MAVRIVPGVQPERGEITRVALASPAALERLAEVSALLVERERPFGIVLQVDGFELDRHRDAFPRASHLPGGRARFGAWCRGVAYIFGAWSSPAGARVHLEHAPRIWGSRIHVARSCDDAAAWLHDELSRYCGSPR